MNSSLPTFRECTAVEKLFNRCFGFLVGLGLGPARIYLLQVRGRKTGKIFSIPAISGRLSRLTSRVTDEFEETVEIDPNGDSALPSEGKTRHVVTRALHSGRYRLEIAVKDGNAARKGIWCRALVVPAYSPSESPHVVVGVGRTC